MSNLWLQTLLRLGVAVAAGGVIGWERQLNNRPAGLRTHMMVSLGSALIISIPLASGITDTSRVIQGVATGIGFLCAGEILRQTRDGEERITGLTSSASLWVTAGIGMVSASGLWHLAAIGTGLTVLILMFKRIQPARNRPTAPDLRPDLQPGPQPGDQVGDAPPKS